MNRIRVLCVLALVVLAGCTGPVEQTEPATVSSENPAETDDLAQTTTEESDGADGPLAVDETAIFGNVEALLSVEKSRPPLSVSREASLGPARSTPGRFAHELGVSNATRDQPSPVRGRTTRGGVIELTVSEAATPRDVRTLLVHEYVHSTQFQLESYRMVRRISVESSARAGRAVTEGAAVYVTQRYATRYGTVSEQQQSVCNEYDHGAPATKIALGPYCVGARYVEDRIGSSDELSNVYENPPRTTEQVRHGLDPGTEPARPLAVSPKSTEEWTVTNAGLPTGSRRQGELWTYAVLTTYLSEERADRAATGWGNDTLVRYGNGSETNRVWVTRWDDPDEAGEFASAMEAHVVAAEANGTTDAAFELVRVNETVVVLVAGSDAFVAAASVGMDDGTVVVRPPQARSDATVSVDVAE